MTSPSRRLGYSNAAFTLSGFDDPSPSRRLGYSNAAFTLSGFDDQERNLLIVKIAFQV